MPSNVSPSSSAVTVSAVSGARVNKMQKNHDVALIVLTDPVIAVLSDAYL